MATFTEFLIESTFKYHRHLNSIVWDGDKLKPEVRKKLLRIASEYYDYLEMPEFPIVDIIFTGSLANYNYTRYSDIDLHVILDVPKTQGKESGLDLDDLLDTKKKLWGETHDITIYNYPVELYAQLKDETLTATGVYSIKQDKWNIKPSYLRDLKVDEYAIKIKAKAIKKTIDRIVSSRDEEVGEIKSVQDKLKNMRKAGLKHAGEFSVENLVYKELRNAGYLEKLSIAKRNAFDDELSLD